MSDQYRAAYYLHTVVDVHYVSDVWQKWENSKWQRKMDQNQSPVADLCGILQSAKNVGLVNLVSPIKGWIHDKAMSVMSKVRLSQSGRTEWSVVSKAALGQVISTKRTFHYLLHERFYPAQVTRSSTLSDSIYMQIDTY